MLCLRAEIRAGTFDLDGDGVCIIEWADKFPDLLPAHTQWFRFTHRPDGARDIEYSV